MGAVVGQGMLAGALVSQEVLDDGVMKHLPPGRELQMEYGDVPLAQLVWIDDVMKTSETLEQAIDSNAQTF